MTFSSLDAVLLTIAFLVPGFVWECALQIFLRRREERADRTWIRFLTLSAFNYGLWSWLIYLLLIRCEVLSRPWVAALAWFCILFVSPAVLGAATGLLSQRPIVRRVLAGFGVHTVHPVPTAWDYVFSHLPPTGFWVLVTLVDGSTVAGVLSDRSFASSDPLGARSLPRKSLPRRGRRRVATCADEQGRLDSRKGPPRHRVPGVSGVESAERILQEGADDVTYDTCS